MAVWGRSPLLVGIPLWMSFGSAAALTELNLCYMLDVFLFLYSIIMTALYSRMKFNPKEAKADNPKAKKGIVDAVYTGLTPHKQDLYATVGDKK